MRPISSANLPVHGDRKNFDRQRLTSTKVAAGGSPVSADVTGVLFVRAATAGFFFAGGFAGGGIGAARSSTCTGFGINLGVPIGCADTGRSEIVCDS
jgi:hypothetical protein